MQDRRTAGRAAPARGMLRASTMSDTSSPSFAPGSPRSQAVTIEEIRPWGSPAGGTAPAGGAPAGWRSVTLRNGQLEVVLLPEKGARSTPCAP